MDISLKEAVRYSNSRLPASQSICCPHWPAWIFAAPPISASMGREILRWKNRKVNHSSSSRDSAMAPSTQG